jgi:hypothetical protein
VINAADFSVGEVVLLLLCPVELLLVRGETLLFPRLHVSQQFNAVGLDVLFHVVALDKPPGNKKEDSTHVSREIRKYPN